MFLPNLLIVVAFATISFAQLAVVPVLATLSFLSTEHKTKFSTTSDEKCITLREPPNKEKSSITFTLGDTVKAMADKQNLTLAGIRQSCYSPQTKTFEHDTENWGYADLTYVPQTITVELDRCKEEHSRFAHTYTVVLCDKDRKCHDPDFRFDIDTNHALGMERRFCNPVGFKNVNIKDLLPWK